MKYLTIPLLLFNFLFLITSCKSQLRSQDLKNVENKVRRILFAKGATAYLLEIDSVESLAHDTTEILSNFRTVELSRYGDYPTKKAKQLSKVNIQAIGKAIGSDSFYYAANVIAPCLLIPKYVIVVKQGENISRIVYSNNCDKLLLLDGLEASQVRLNIKFKYSSQLDELLGVIISDF